MSKKAFPKSLIGIFICLISLTLGSATYATTEVEENGTMRTATKVDLKSGTISGYTESTGVKTILL